MVDKLAERGIDLPKTVLTLPELADALAAYRDGRGGRAETTQDETADGETAETTQTGEGSDV